MTETAAPLAFAPTCSTGHKLQGFVRYCPYCGLAVPPVKVAQGEASETVVVPKLADTALMLTPSVDVTQQSDPVAPRTHPPVDQQAQVSKSEPCSGAQRPVPEAPVAKDEAPAPTVDIEKTTSDVPSLAQPRSNAGGSPDSVQYRGRPKGRGWIWGLVLLMLLVAVGGAVYFPRLSKPDDCQASLQTAVALEDQGDFVGARAQAEKAITACGANVNEQAQRLMATIDQKMTAQARCERLFTQIASLLTDRRLQSAKSAIERMDPTCTKFAKSRELQDRLKDKQAAALEALNQGERFLDAQDKTRAATAIGRLAEVDREHQGLPQLRKRLQVIDLPPPPTPLPAKPLESGAGPKSEMAKPLLRNAEQALAQMRFDAAKTFVESALSVDPQNLEAQTLARRIRERELEYLKSSTTIK